jgi:hypothetical protein
LQFGECSSGYIEPIQVPTAHRYGIHYQALVDAGIQYFVIQMLDAGDSQTIRLLAEQIVLAIKG